MLLFFILQSTIATNCKEGVDMWSGHSDLKDSYFVARKGKQNKIYLFLSPSLGSSSLIYEYYGVKNWTSLGHLMFLDISGQGYSKITATKQLSLDEITSLYFIAYNDFSKCISYASNQLYIVSGGVGAKIAINLHKNIEQSKLILLSPVINFKYQIQNLPSLAFDMGLIDFQERVILEGQIIGNTNTYSDYIQFVNQIAKLSGDMQIVDYRKYGIDDTQLKMTQYYNTIDVRKAYSADGVFFYTQNIETFNLMKSAIDEEIVLSKDISGIFIPQFSLLNTIQGSWPFWIQLQSVKKEKFETYTSNNITTYTRQGPLYIIHNSGDRLYYDQSKLVQQLIANIK